MKALGAACFLVSGLITGLQCNPYPIFDSTTAIAITFGLGIGGALSLWQS